MIEDKELGLKVAESPREALIKETLSNVEKSILAIELELELKKQALEFLKTLK